MVVDLVAIHLLVVDVKCKLRHLKLALEHRVHTLHESITGETERGRTFQANCTWLTVVI